jgi:hypothetical protein
MAVTPEEVFEKMDAPRRPKPEEQAAAVTLLPSGAVVAHDGQGRQIRRWSAQLLCDHLRKLRAAGALAPGCRVNTLELQNAPLADWIGEDPTSTPA